MINFTLDKNNMANLITKILELDKSKLWKVSIKEWIPTRSLPSNEYYWQLITAMAEHFGLPDRDEMHDVMKYKFLSKTKNIKGKDIVTIKSTSKLTQSEFNEYLAKVKYFAFEHGFQLDDN